MFQLHPDTIRIQNKFGNYCRTGIFPDIDGIDKNRMKQYRKLVSTAITSPLERAFPISFGVLSPSEWELLTEDFIRHHDNRTPQIWKLPYEFFQFIRDSNYKSILRKPWLDDLFFFEWIEIEIHTMPDGVIKKHRKKGDLQKDRIYFNPDHQIINLTYPVHLMSADESVNHRGSYFLLIFRELKSGDVRFVNLGLFHAVLLEQLLNTKSNLNIAIEATAQLLNLEHSETLIEKSIPLLQSMAKNGFLLGFID